MPTFSYRELKREKKRQLVAAHGRKAGSEMAKHFEDPEAPDLQPPHWRPQTYGDCQSRPRPCPYAGCKYHLFLETTPSGSVTTLAVEIDKAPETCALDVASQGGKTLEEVGAMLGISRERVRQIEKTALKTMAKHLPTEMQKIVKDLESQAETSHGLHQATTQTQIVRSDAKDEDANAA